MYPPPTVGAPPQMGGQGQMPGPMGAPSAPQPPQAPPAVPKIDDTPIPMSADDLAAWWGRVDQAVRARKDRETRWETLLRSYLPTTDPDTLNSNIHFRNTEQKKDTIFYRSPDLILTPLFPLQDVTIGPDGSSTRPKTSSRSSRPSSRRNLGRVAWTSSGSRTNSSLTSCRSRAVARPILPTSAIRCPSPIP